MAKNWNMAEATKVIVDGTNDAALQDLGRRFPLTTVKLAKIGAKAPEITELMAAFPDHMTVRKIESALKDGVDEVEIDDVEDDEEIEEKPAKAKKAPVKKAAKAEPEDDEGEYAGMSAMDLYKECKNRGIKCAAKKPAKYYVELLEKDDASSDDDDWDDEPEEKPAKKAPAKKAAAKKPAKKAEPEDDDDDDDEWDI